MKMVKVSFHTALCILGLGTFVPGERDAAQPLVLQNFVTSADNLKINTVYIPAMKYRADNPTVICAHGATHYIDKLRPTMLTLAREGFNIIGIDCRGHGKSDGHRGDIPSFDHLVDDFMTVYNHYKKNIRGKLFTLSHSAGSLTVVRTLQKNNIPIEASILISPCLGLSKNMYWGHRKALLPMLSSASPTYSIALSTRNPRKYQPVDDHKCLKTVTARSLYEVVKHSRYALRNTHKIDSSIHILLPEEDDVVDNEKTMLFYERLPSDIKKSLLVYKDMPHSMLDTKDPHSIHQSILSILDRHAPAGKPKARAVIKPAIRVATKKQKNNPAPKLKKVLAATTPLQKNKATQ